METEIHVPFKEDVKSETIKCGKIVENGNFLYSNAQIQAHERRSESVP